MWEEEKMARDVYILMLHKYQYRIFMNIMGSEQAHMDSIKHLLDQADISVPVDEKQVGLFSNPEINNLYKCLVAQGEKSRLDAFKVGLEVEITDIDDLTSRLQTVKDPGIRSVYEALREASFRHKAAFERHLEMF